MINYYDVLEVSSTASKEEIKEAYKKVSVKVHPDKYGGDEYYTEIFQVVNDAKAILTDEAKRSEYDQRLKDSLRSSRFGSRRSITRLNKKWTILLSLSAFFFVVVILLPAVDLKEFVQKPPYAEALYYIPEKPGVTDNGRPEPLSPGNGPSRQLTAENNKISAIKDGVEARLHRPGRSLNNTNTVLLADTRLSPNNQAIVPTGGFANTQNKRMQEIVLDQSQMLEILEQLVSMKQNISSNINCVRVLQTRDSNVKNAFDIASFFRDHGFIIAGRELIKKTVNGTLIAEDESCFQVTIGTY